MIDPKEYAPHGLDGGGGDDKPEMTILFRKSEHINLFRKMPECVMWSGSYCVMREVVTVF